MTTDYAEPVSPRLTFQFVTGPNAALAPEYHPDELLRTYPARKIVDCVPRTPRPVMISTSDTNDVRYSIGLPSTNASDVDLTKHYNCALQAVDIVSDSVDVSSLCVLLADDDSIHLYTELQDTLNNFVTTRLQGRFEYSEIGETVKLAYRDERPPLIEP